LPRAHEFRLRGPGAALNAADIQPVASGADVAAAGNGQAGAGTQSVQPQKTVVDKVYIAPTPAPKSSTQGAEQSVNRHTVHWPTAQGQQSDSAAAMAAVAGEATTDMADLRLCHRAGLTSRPPHPGIRGTGDCQAQQA